MQSENDFFASKLWKVDENPERNGTLFSVFVQHRMSSVLCLLERSWRDVGRALILLSPTSRDLHGERLRGEREGDLVRSMEGWLSLAAVAHLCVELCSLFSPRIL